MMCALRSKLNARIGERERVDRPNVIVKHADPAPTTSRERPTGRRWMVQRAVDPRREGWFSERTPQPLVPLRVLLGRCLPVLSLLPGHEPVQLARCPAVRKTLMSAPTSAMITSALIHAVDRAHPGNLLRKKWRSPSTCARRVAMTSS